MGRGYSANRSHSARPTNKTKRPRSSGAGRRMEELKDTLTSQRDNMAGTATSVVGTQGGVRDPTPGKDTFRKVSRRAPSNLNRTSSRMASVERKARAYSSGSSAAIRKAKKMASGNKKKKNDAEDDSGEVAEGDDEESESSSDGFSDDEPPSEDECETIRRPDVLNKYTEGGKIVDRVLSSMEEACVPGANTRDICHQGDADIMQSLKTVFKHNSTIGGKAAASTAVDAGRKSGESQGPRGRSNSNATGRAQDRQNSTASRASSKAASRARSASSNPLATWYNTGVARGVAFPCTVSVNHTLCHHAPFTDKDSVTLKVNDIVKVHCGAHIDGYPVMAARTFVVKPSATESGDDVRDVPVSALNTIEAARMALGGMARVMRPGTDTDDVTDFVAKVGIHYDAEAIEGVLSTRTKRWIPDALQSIICRRVNKEEPIQEVMPSIVEPFQIWNLDVAFTDSPCYKMQVEGAMPNPVNIYRKNEVSGEAFQDLRSQAATELLHTEIKNKFFCFPFNPLHANEPLKARLGLRTLRTTGQIDAFPQLHCKKVSVNQRAAGAWQHITSRFSATIAITEKKIHFLCGAPDVASSVQERYGHAMMPGATVAQPSADIMAVLCSPLTITRKEDAEAPRKKARAEAKMKKLLGSGDGSSAAIQKTVAVTLDDATDKIIGGGDEDDSGVAPAPAVSKLAQMHPDFKRKKK